VLSVTNLAAQSQEGVEYQLTVMALLAVLVPSLSSSVSSSRISVIQTHVSNFSSRNWQHRDDDPDRPFAANLDNSIDLYICDVTESTVSMIAVSIPALRVLIRDASLKGHSDDFNLQENSTKSGRNFNRTILSPGYKQMSLETQPSSLDDSDIAKDPTTSVFPMARSSSS